jgi:thiol:disulfide interchange protein DsbA
MSTSRRKVLVGLSGAALLTSLPAARAQERAFEQSFRAITPQPVAGDRIEIIDFFWYGCPYCFQLMPMLAEWEKTKPADVVVRRIPAILQQHWLPGAHLFYTLQSLGEADRLHEKVFNAIHRERLEDTDNEGWSRWAEANGVERAKWDAAYSSREVRDKVVRAVETGRDYDVRGTPVLVVDGRWQTGGGQAGSLKNIVPTIDGLINMARQLRKKGV